ncbi:MAG: GNAT family N-acetyltransferase [Rubrobacter sp.]|nr:GNAT family N-acetyltransferase [Rubrobacter sp.]
MGGARASDISVRKVDGGNEAAVRSLSVTEAQLAFVSHISGMLRGANANPGVESYATLADGEAVGFFILNFDASRTAHYAAADAECGLEGFFIDHRFQGRGYGSAAVRAMRVTVAREHPGIEKVKLTVNCRNEAAIYAYLEGGFRDTGEIYHGGRSGPQRILAMPLHRRAKKVHPPSNPRRSGPSRSP